MLLYVLSCPLYTQQIFNVILFLFYQCTSFRNLSSLILLHCSLFQNSDNRDGVACSCLLSERWTHKNHGSSRFVQNGIYVVQLSQYVMYNHTLYLLLFILKCQSRVNCIFQVIAKHAYTVESITSLQSSTHQQELLVRKYALLFIRTLIIGYILTLHYQNGRSGCSVEVF